VKADNCTDVISHVAAGRKFTTFGGNVAHAIHSITANMLRKFEPTIGEKNNVPTVDLDLRSETPLLEHAPLDEQSPFDTEGMKLIDAVLSHMDNPHYDVRGFTTLERVVHAFHMVEGYEMIVKEYKALKEAGGVPDDICACLNDIEHNGIRKAMRFIALAIREPALVYNAPTLAAYYVPYTVTYRFLNDKVKDTAKVFNPDELLLDQTDSMPALKDQESWKVWKKLLTSMETDMHQDAALFLYCRLNKFK
jgi:hypothetical protein